jgi:hypothetical protein
MAAPVGFSQAEVSYQKGASQIGGEPGWEKWDSESKRGERLK